MYNKLAIDFGTSNTVVAFWDEEKQDVVLHHIPDVTLPFHFNQDGKELEIPYIPSLIYYQDIKTRFIGYQVIEKSLERSQGAFRWMKAYIHSKRMMEFPLPDGNRIDYRQAARDFLENIILFAHQSGHVDFSSCEVIFSVPVESFEYYTDWLSDACLKIGVRRYRFIDEPTACIFGYAPHLQLKDIFLIFDFGGGTLDVSIIRIEEEVKGGKGCFVLGKAGCHIGGRSIDGWIYNDILNKAKISALDARQASGLFMRQVEEIKEKLTNETSVKYDLRHEPTKLRLEGIYARTMFEDLMEENGLYIAVQETLDRALKDAYEKGIKKEALLVGGTSQIPSIRRQVRTLFGEKTKYYRPYDAVARGACKFLTSGAGMYDHILHDYALKGYDSKTGTHHFEPLVPKGTRYPTKSDFKQLTLKAVRDGQRFFGIDIYEIAQKGVFTLGAGELIRNLNGDWVYETQRQDVEAGTEFWMNEKKPTFIEANPPGERGVPRFSIVFSVDAQKRLVMTVRDIKTQSLVYQDYPVVKLK